MAIEPSTIVYIVAGLLGLIGVGAYMRKEKKVLGQNKNLVAFIGVAAAVFLVTMQMGYLSDFGLSPLSAAGGAVITTQGTQGTQGTQISTGGVCPPGSPEDTTVTLSAVDKYTSTAAGGTHRYKINGAPAKTVSDAGTFTASPGDIIEILWGNGSTSYSYFGDVSNEPIPCNKGTITFSKELIQNGTISISVFNEEGNLIDSSGENETLGAGDVANLKIEVRGENKKGFAHGGVITVELNGTDFDEENIELELGDISVTKLKSNPNVHSLTSTDNKAVSFEIGPLEGATLHTGTLTLDVDDTYNPGNANDPVITFRPYNYFINEDNGGAFEGPDVEDEDNTATYGHSTTFTVHVD